MVSTLAATKPVEAPAGFLKEAMRLLLLGRTGQVGTELRALATSRCIDVTAPGVDELDLTDAPAIARMVAAEPWGAVINAAAYADVDRAER